MRPHESHRRRREEISKLDIKEDANCNLLAEGRDRCGAVMNTTIKNSGSIKRRGIF